MEFDNQQETQKAYIAGLFEGEGSIHMYKLNIRGNATSYRGNIQFTNTDKAICKKFIDFLKEYKLSYHIRTDRRGKTKKGGKLKKICYQIQITRIKDKVNFLEILEPYFIGDKKSYMQIVNKFLKRRLNIFKNYKRETGRDGRFKSGCKSSFNEIDEKLYNEYKKLRESSETKCETPIIIG